MNIFGELVKALIRTPAPNQPDPHALLVQYRTKLEWTVDQFKRSEEDYPTTLGALLHYDVRNNHCPPTILDLKRFVEHNPDSNQTLVKQLEIIMTELEMLEEDESEISTDIEMLMRTAFDKGAAHYDTVTYGNAARIAAGEIVYPPKTDKTGPTVARIYVSDRNSKRINYTPKGPAGDLAVNQPLANLEIDKFLEGASDYRILTGFKDIDDKILIGPKHQKWIGLLGYTNHGKSGFLMSMVYNMAKEGARVLLVPREFSVVDAWHRFMWMHSQKFPNEPLIDVMEWKGLGIKNLDPWRAKNLISSDIVNNGLKGSIDCQNFSTWEEIEEHLLIRSYKDPVDVLAVDYIGHLDVCARGGSKQEEELNKVFRKAQLLTQNGIQNDGSGLVIISPLQANKKHYAAAAKEEDPNKWGVYTADAVDYFSQAARDMDVLMGIWAEGALDLESPKQAMVYCIKSRGEKFIKHNIEIEKISRYYRDIRPKVEDINIEATPVVKEANMVEDLN